MTVIANRRIYHDILPYQRRAPQYSRGRLVRREPAVAGQPKVQAVTGIKNIDGVHSGRSRTIPVVQPSAIGASAAGSPIPVRQQASTPKQQKPQIIDMVVRTKRIEHMPVVAPPQQVLQQSGQQPAQGMTIAQQFEQSYQTDAGTAPGRSLGQKLLRILPVGMAALMLLAGVGVFVWTVRTNKQVVAQVQASATSESVSAEEQPPAEDEVTAAAIGNYRVAPDAPRTLKIDKIDVFSRIQRIGTMRSGEMAAPKNIHDTGWYEGSSKPGDGGAVLLVGHVHGPSRPGVFKDLHKLEAGDVLTVYRGDEKDFNYRIIKKEQVPADQVDMAAALVPVTPGKAGLNIITCAGDILPGTAQYADRIVLYAEQI